MLKFLTYIYFLLLFFSFAEDLWTAFCIFTYSTSLPVYRHRGKRQPQCHSMDEIKWAYCGGMIPSTRGLLNTGCDSPLWFTPLYIGKVKCELSNVPKH